jgi:cytochrome c553
MNESRILVVTFIAASVFAGSMLMSSRGASSEPIIPILVAGQGSTECDAFFVRNQCVTCHEPSGTGPQRANLTPAGLDYMKKHLGCMASATTVAAEGAVVESQAKPEHEHRMELVRSHFLAFSCNRCHETDGKGVTRSNLVPYGMESHLAGKGCIQCQNVIKAKAGRTDLLEAPHYAKE